MSLADRVLVGLAALAGLLGIALSAAAAHVTGGSLSTAAQFLLFHAPAILAIAGLAAAGLIRPRLGRSAGFVLLMGLLLFCGDLTRRAFGGGPLVPMAAPAGGIVLMIGWLLIGAAAFVGPRR